MLTVAPTGPAPALAPGPEHDAARGICMIHGGQARTTPAPRAEKTWTARARTQRSWTPPAIMAN